MDTNYQDLINTTASQLGVDTIVFELELKYVVTNPFPPLKIHSFEKYTKESTLDTPKCFMYI